MWKLRCTDGCRGPGSKPAGAEDARAGWATFVRTGETVTLLGSSGHAQSLSPPFSSAAITRKRPRRIRKGMCVAVFQENCIYKDRQQAVACSLLGGRKELGRKVSSANTRLRSFISCVTEASKAVSRLLLWSAQCGHMSLLSSDAIQAPINICQGSEAASPGRC